MATELPPAVYRFDRFVLDLRRGVLLADGKECALRPKSFALLRYLVENAERLISRDEIMHAVWPDTFVTEDSITQCIKEIRRTLGNGAQPLLRTLTRRGYLLAVPVSRLDTAAAAAVPVSGTVAALPRELSAPPTGRPVVILLPFENIGDDPAQGYFANGLTTDLATDLTRFQDLHIVAPQLQGTDPASPAPDASLQALPPGARYVLSGTVRRAGGRIRIAVQLGDAHSGVSLWAERFDRPLEDLFSVQEDLTNHIAASVDIQVGREGLRRARRHPPANLDAYDLYLRGRELHGRTTEADTLLAREVLDRAIAADPNYAPAYAYQAYIVLRGYIFEWGQPRGRAALDLALELASRGVALEPDSSLCVMRLAFVLALLGRHDEAVAIGGRGVRANPSDAASRATYGEILSMAGAHAAGAAELRLAISLNPYHPPFWTAPLGRALLLAGQAGEALTELQRCAALAPDYRPCHSSLVVACIETGDLAGARAALRQVHRLWPGLARGNYDAAFEFRNQSDTDRFRAAFRAADAAQGQGAMAAD